MYLDQYEIATWEKTPCVKYTTSMTSKPKKVSHYWPIGIGANYFDSIEGKTGSDIISSGGGVFRVRRGVYDWVTVVLKEGGKTQPIKTITEDYPTPKTKLETRYINGHWEKYSKVKGWLRA